MIGKLRLGYPGGALDAGLDINRTCRMNERHPQQVIPMAIKIAHTNLIDLEKLIEYNEKIGIRFFRISSEILPHISNWRLIDANRLDFHQLAYDINQFQPILQRIGKLAKKYGHRLTFHPGFFTVLNTTNHFALISVMRELWWHTMFLKLADLDINSVLILHIGGTGNDKLAATQQFVTNFNILPADIKWRIAIENDETKYNAEDVLRISHMIKPYEYEYDGVKYTCKLIPICFDYFHYCVYNRYRQRNSNKYEYVRPIEQILPEIAATWENKRRQKMHLSEQLDYGVIGAHSYLIEEIPKQLLYLDIDLMIEARDKERAVFHLLKKYNT